MSRAITTPAVNQVTDGDTDRADSKNCEGSEQAAQRGRGSSSLAGRVFPDAASARYETLAQTAVTLKLMA